MPNTYTDQIAIPKTAAPVKLRCFHCKEDCVDDRYRVDDRVFCCRGCQTVFEILHENQLCAFYTLDENAGLSQRKKHKKGQFDYLNDPDILENLLEYRRGSTAQVTFYLPLMHCVSCIWLLERLPQLHPGIEKSRVNFLKKSLTVRFDLDKITLAALAELSTSVGYEPEINLGDTDGKNKTGAAAPTLVLQIATAGFAFGNIMLFSFPEYVGMDSANNRDFASVFGGLSLALALPVLLFSARDYFISAWRGLQNRQLNIDIPLCLALGSLFGRSVWEILTQTGGGYLDSFAGLTFLLLIGKWFQQHTWNRLSFERDYKSWFPVAASLKKGSRETATPLHKLLPGDIIVVRNGEIIPADGILTKGDARVDYSFVTGESETVRPMPGERIYAGGKQTGAGIEISLTARPAQSKLTRLWNNGAFKTEFKGRAGALADQAGRVFSWIILTTGVAAGIYWWGFRNDVHTAVNAFTAIMIVACPCTIALSIPFTLGNITRLLGRHGFYLKNNGTVEGLADFDCVVFDKTGTLTDTHRQAPEFVGQPLSEEEKSILRSLAFHSSHPLSRSIYATVSGSELLPVQHYRETPGAGIEGEIKGIRVKLGSAEFTGESAAPNGGVYLTLDGKGRGRFAVRSALRAGLGEVIDYFRQKGNLNGIFLLSGDGDRDAERLKPLFPENTEMYFGQSPEDKLNFVKDLQAKGRKVLMIGDGLNDAGALRQSDTGIVVSENVNNFTPSCDAILDARVFEGLPALIGLASNGVRIVKQSYAVSFLYNAVGLGFAVSGRLSPLIAAILMPLSSISIVLFGVVMGNLAAKKLKNNAALKN